LIFVAITSPSTQPRKLILAMSKKDPKIFLNDILESIERIEEYTKRQN
jgi:hypothetical protein